MSSAHLKKLLGIIKNLPSSCGYVCVIGIDGPAGSGKTTLANSLAKLLPDSFIVHMDDLYEGWNQDLLLELAERIKEEILEPIQNGLEANFKKYDWAKESFVDSVHIPKCQYLILEGVGSTNPLLTDFLAIRIWVEANPDQLLDRLIERDGLALKNQLMQWQKHETNYFSELGIKDRADFQFQAD